MIKKLRAVLAGADVIEMPSEEEIIKESENKKEYYMSKKYRRKYILTLLRYHIKNDWMAFEDLCEDNISCIVPFKSRGRKRIETLDEAFEAAKNFADYVS